MGNAVALSTLLSDLRFLLDLESTNGRLTDAQGERLLNRSRDKLFGMLLEAYGDGRFTYCVGIELKPGSTGARSIPLGETISGVDDTWGAATASNPTFHSPGSTATRASAPGFVRLLKVQLPESYTAESVTEGSLEPFSQWSGRVVNLNATSLDMLNTSDQAETWSITRPPTYRLIENNVLFFDPPPTGNVGVLVWYVGNPITITGATATVLEPNWADFIVYDAAVTFAIRDRDSSAGVAELKDERARLQNAILDQARDRDDYSPKTIRNTFQRDIPEGELRDLVTLKL